ncbi:MAG TPA: hypothetical protein VER08_01170 [Pyrinomonadaceae bacterium]|nr:hypothetical protein [Pyrinomonadaceae bacterium]
MRSRIHTMTERAARRLGPAVALVARRRMFAVALAAAVLALSAPASRTTDAAGAARATYATRAALAADEAGARRALESAFQTLRAGRYADLYDVLPSASQRRITRARFVESLNRARGMYELERLEVSRVSVAGDLAAADTIIYGRALRPVVADGKIVARQYLVREGGRWRVTTGDRQTVGPLLAAHPDFARRHPPRQPRVYVRRDGRWVDVSTLVGTRRR